MESLSNIPSVLPVFLLFSSLLYDSHFDLVFCMTACMPLALCFFFALWWRLQTACSLRK